MINTIVTRVFLCSMVLSLLTLLTTGCGRTQTKPDQSKPPQIPPQSAFVMDFNDFTSSGSSSSGVFQPAEFAALLVLKYLPLNNRPDVLGARGNWTFAALNVGFWSVVGFVGLAIPGAAFVESIKQTPVKQPDNSWIWTYSITVQGITYTAELHGKYIDTGVHWEMYITKQNEYTDFLWYFGESDLGATRGYWVLKDKPSNPTDLLRIDWHRNPANQTGDIKYLNIATGGAENGGYISFTVTKDEPYNRAYVIFNKGKDETTYIEWNSATKAGRVKDEAHFNDNSWHYWDSSLKDIVSP